MPPRHPDPLASALIDVVEGIMGLNRSATAILDMPKDYDASRMILDFQRDDQMVGRELRALKQSISMPTCEDTTGVQRRIEQVVTNGVGYNYRLEKQLLESRLQ